MKSSIYMLRMCVYTYVCMYKNRMFVYKQKASHPLAVQENEKTK